MSAEVKPPALEKVHAIFPVAYGNEEETGLMDDSSGSMDEPYMLAGDLQQYVPPEVQSSNSDNSLFLRNSAKIYAGGSGSVQMPTNIERATQECARPSQLALAVQAGELLLVKTVENFAKTESLATGRTITARIQRRVVDGKGSRKGSHDNFALNHVFPFKRMFGHNGTVTPDVLAYGASQSVLDGAGYVSPYGMRFSQKVGGLSSVYGYAYGGSMFRMTTAEGNMRIETRHNDINLSPWQIQARIGGMALALALSQTPLAHKLPHMDADDVINQAKRMNRLNLNEDGTIESSPWLAKAIGIQQASVELVLSQLGLYVDEIPEELYWAAHARYSFCDDLKRVVKGDATVALLADRVDWAAKTSLILARMQSDKAEGRPRSMTDMISRAADMRYDYREIQATDGKLAKPKLGTGYKLRDKGKFQGRPYSPRQIQTAYRHPIEGTRATLRAYLLEHYHVIKCGWNYVVLHDESGSEYSPKFDLGEVSQTEFSEWDQERLASFKQIR